MRDRACDLESVPTTKIELSEWFVAFEDLEDPRSSRNRLHPLVSVPAIGVLALLCEADGPTRIRGWAAARQQGSRPMELTFWQEVELGGRSSC